MRLPRVIGTTIAVLALVGTVFLYSSHSVRGSDHQDSNVMVNRPGADITDGYLFPAGDNPNNVVFVMNVHPLIPAGMGTATFFDPAVLYQFKFVHTSAAFAPGTASSPPEDTVIQFLASGTGSNQTIAMYGPAKPNTTGTNSTLVAQTGTATYNQPTTLNVNGQSVQVFAGPRADPFYVDLAQFFKIVPDRAAMYHQPGQTVPPPSATSFRGFSAAYNAANGTNCDTSQAGDILSPNGPAFTGPSPGFNELSIVVEMPKSLINPPGAGQVLHMWLTTSTTTGT